MISDKFFFFTYFCWNSTGISKTATAKSKYIFLCLFALALIAHAILLTMSVKHSHLHTIKWHEMKSLDEIKNGKKNCMKKLSFLLLLLYLSFLFIYCNSYLSYIVLPKFFVFFFSTVFSHFVCVALKKYERKPKIISHISCTKNRVE